MCHTEAKDRGEDPPALKQNSCGVFNDRRPTKICKKFPKWRKTETEHGNEQRANKENRTGYRHKENRETPAPMSATDMTAKLFRAMSKASWDQVRCLYLVAFAGMFADQQPEPEPYRDRTLVMLMHLEDQEAWKKIYTTLKTLTDEVFE